MMMMIVIDNDDSDNDNDDDDDDDLMLELLTNLAMSAGTHSDIIINVSIIFVIIILVITIIIIIISIINKPGYERRNPLHRLGRGHPHRLTQCDSRMKNISAAKNAKNMHTKVGSLSLHRYITPKKYHSHVL